MVRYQLVDGYYNNYSTTITSDSVKWERISVHTIILLLQLLLLVLPYSGSNGAGATITLDCSVRGMTILQASNG